ncbi:uncharacterized protein LOC141852796 [Brevipalpus obovatus]|uniref:uncharacterized protein LOC141852796 n=1 Tax=Brevipalpus obovatus TaxID=246614 RepID=UPI003D9EC626
MKFILWSAHTLLVILIANDHIIGNHGSRLKVDFGVNIPSMTFKLPTFNFPRLKLTAVIHRPANHQAQPMKLTLPAISLNAQSADEESYEGEDDGWKGQEGYESPQEEAYHHQQPNPQDSMYQSHEPPYQINRPFISHAHPYSAGSSNGPIKMQEIHHHQGSSHGYSGYNVNGANSLTNGMTFVNSDMAHHQAGFAERSSQPEPQHRAGASSIVPVNSVAQSNRIGEQNDAQKKFPSVKRDLSNGDGNNPNNQFQPSVNFPGHHYRMPMDVKPDQFSTNQQHQQHQQYHPHGHHHTEMHQANNHFNVPSQTHHTRAPARIQIESNNGHNPEDNSHHESGFGRRTNTYLVRRVVKLNQHNRPEIAHLSTSSVHYPLYTSNQTSAFNTSFLPFRPLH